MEKILLVDDNNAVLEALSLLLEIHGYQVVTAQSPIEAKKAVSYQKIALVIQDMNFTTDTTSGEEGCSLFHALREINPDLPIILITAWTELEQAISLVKAGAADYIPKPWDDEKLLSIISGLLQEQRNTPGKRPTRYTNAKSTASQSGLIYQSPAMQNLVEMALQVARSDINVLITGPNGSGKEKIAELIQSASDLHNKPFIKVNAGALPPDLMEAELFGAEAGAYTGANKARIGRFEAADGGTLFLDEIGNLSAAGQMKLLRVLQTGEFERLGSVTTQKVNVRVISATNADLRQDIANGQFREDLFYRLNVIELHLPALRERSEDIAPLLGHFLPDRVISQETLNALQAYSWPGNVRELENACKRVAVLRPQGEIQLQDFALHHLPATGTSEPQTLAFDEPSKAELEQSIAQHNGVIAHVARQFGLSRQSLYRRLKKFGIDY